MRRVGKRLVAFMMALWLFLTVSVDGQAKAVLAVRDCIRYGATLAATDVSSGDMTQSATADEGEDGDTYAGLDSLEDVEAVDKDFTYYAGNGIDIVWNVGKSSTDKFIQGKIADFCLTTGNKINSSGVGMLNNSAKLSTSVANMQTEIDALRAKVGTPGSKGVQKRLDKLLAKQEGKAGAASSMASKGDFYKVSGKIMAGASIGFDAYSIYKDVESLGSLKHEHSSMRAIEGSLYVADIGFSVASIGVAGVILAGGTVAAPVLAVVTVGGLIVGVASAIFGSDGFANLMNNADNDFLRGFDNMVSSLFQNIKTALGIGCYKPNIYIYGADGELVEVIFGEPGLLVTSDPYYSAEDGWRVIAENDGTLRDGNGREYGYLFYESATEKTMFETEEGFYIEGARRAEILEEILRDYGFNEREISDFVEFWNQKLEAGVDYLMYPQYTEAVDAAMPIEISPAPDNVCRIWFVFEEYRQQDYEPADVIPFVRTGYSVVEWGGMIF